MVFSFFALDEASYSSGVLLYFSLMQISVLGNGISSHCGALGQILYKPDSLDLCFTWMLTSSGTQAVDILPPRVIFCDSS